MNASQLIQQAGFAVLKATDGEDLILIVNPSDATTNVKLTNVIVNRNIVKGRDFMRLFKDFAGDFEVMGLTEVEIDRAQLTNPPEAGQYFTDGIGYKHRIRYVSQTPGTWLAYCTPSAI